MRTTKVQINLQSDQHLCCSLLSFLHAEVSYIIDITGHWTFFSNITSFNYFLDCQDPRFFSIFQLPIFAEPYPSNLCLPMSVNVTGLKHTISPYFGMVWVLFYNISGFSMKICTKSRNLGWKQRKFQQNWRCFGSRNWETDACHVRMWFAQLCHDIMNI